MGAVVWAGCSTGALVVLISAYITLVSRGLRNELVIGSAIAAMRASLDTEPPPQRALLSAVADALTAQERAAAGVEAAVRDLELRGAQVPRPESLLGELLSLPEPQVLVADFLSDHAGSPASDPMFVSVAADILRAATVQAFSDLADQGLVELDLLLLLAYEGRIKNVAIASLDSSLDPNPPRRRVPRVADLDPGAMAEIVGALDWATRRQLRLATVLHSQAEAMLRLRRRMGCGPISIIRRLRAIASFPLPRRADFRLDDLDLLAVKFDGVGEVLEMAAEHLSEGEAARAAHLVSRLRVPVPAGLPGRMFLQESLAQARPLARLGVWHRLAVCRWAASSLDAIAREMADSHRTGSSAGSADSPSQDADR